MLTPNTRSSGIAVGLSPEPDQNLIRGSSVARLPTFRSLRSSGIKGSLGCVVALGPDSISVQIECDTGRKRHTWLALVRISGESTGLTGGHSRDVRNLLESVTESWAETFHLRAEHQQHLQV